MINQFMNLTLNILDVDNKTFSGNYQLSQYGGKELDRENGLDWLDSHARMYDFIIGRTPTMDPMSEKYYPLSPYLWCAGNPLRFIDLTGKEYCDHLSQNRCN